MNEILNKIKKRLSNNLKTIEFAGEQFVIAKDNAIDTVEIISLCKVKAKSNIDQSLRLIKAGSDDIEEHEAIFGKVEDYTQIIGHKKIETLFDIRLISLYTSLLMIYRSVCALRLNGSKVYKTNDELDEWVEVMKGHPNVYNRIAEIQNEYNASGEGNE